MLDYRCRTTCAGLPIIAGVIAGTTCAVDCPGLLSVSPELRAPRPRPHKAISPSIEEAIFRGLGVLHLTDDRATLRSSFGGFERISGAPGNSEIVNARPAPATMRITPRKSDEGNNPTKEKHSPYPD